MLSFVTLIFGLCREASSNSYIGLGIGVAGGANAQVTVKGENTFNSNGFAGILTGLPPNNNLEINVESGATLNSCGNSQFDIEVEGSVHPDATLTFLGTGYTCDQTKVSFPGTVVPPDCQDCPSN